VELLHSERYHSRSAAQAREHAIKQLSRSRKLALARETNR
jgi:predicted GIY-YIG superfamily endonuclease